MSHNVTIRFDFSDTSKYASIPLYIGVSATFTTIFIYIQSELSPLNTLFDFVYEHFKSEFKLLEGIYRTMGIEGHYKETPIIEATFNFEGRDYTSTFSVLDASGAIRQVQDETGIQIHGVLGVQFLIENKWIIDFEQMKVTDEKE